MNFEKLDHPKIILRFMNKDNSIVKIVNLDKIKSIDSYCYCCGTVNYDIKYTDGTIETVIAHHYEET